MSTYHATGIVLRVADYLEADQLFHIYTKEFGKVIALGRGTRKSKSKLRGHLEPFGIVSVMFAHGRTWEQLASAQVIQRFNGCVTDLTKAELGFFASELVSQLTQPGIAEPAVYELLERYFVALQEAELDAKRAIAFRAAFGAKLLGLLGFDAPQLQHGLVAVEDALLRHIERPIIAKRLYLGVK